MFRRTRPRFMHRNAKSGFTIVELLVVIAMIGVLVAMLVPAINSARESGRRANCQNNLRQFGLGMQVHSDRKAGSFCSGGFDWTRDGAVTEIGWVADLIQQGVPVGKMLCPSNPAQISETFTDLLSAPPTPDTCVDKVGSPPTTLPDGTQVTNPCRQIVTQSMAPLSDERRQLVDREILLKHFNTNYTASWLLVRTMPQLDSSGNVVSRKAGCSRQITSRSATFGPLTQAILDLSKVPASLVPLLGCGATAGSLPQDLTGFPAGTMTTLSMTSGPVLRETGQLPSFSTGTSRTGPNGWWAAWSKQALQDYRGFAAVHRSLCNILMADGSVRTFEDRNGDGALNNGFAAVSGAFRSEEIEIPEEEVFSGASLRGL